MNRSRSVIPVLVVVCCAVMALVEAVIQPGYVLKSVCKVLLFGGCTGLYALRSGDPAIRRIFSRAGLKPALALTLCVYALLLGGYWILRHFIDLDAIAAGLREKENLHAGNFLPAALYISLCNSFLEELFFRGFAYLTLRAHWAELPARIFSAAAFALYHVFILTGWFSPVLFALVLGGLFAAGLLFNRLDRQGSLFPSWLVHAGANLAINTVGLMMFGLL